MRARAFHILEPKGTVDMLVIFLEDRSEASAPLLDTSRVSLTEICAAFPFFLISTADLPAHAHKLVHIY